MIFLSRISLDPETLRRRKRRYFWLGLLMILIGAAACVTPFAAAFAIETVLGVSLIAAGVGRLWLAFTEKSFMQLLLMLAALASGAFLLARPLAGMVALGTFLGAFFAVSGAAKCADYFRFRGLTGAFGVFLSGLADIFLAFSVWRNLFSAAAAPGLLLGVNLLLTGAELIALSAGCARMVKMMGASHRFPSDTSPDEC